MILGSSTILAACCVVPVFEAAADDEDDNDAGVLFATLEEDVVAGSDEGLLRGSPMETRWLGALDLSEVIGDIPLGLVVTFFSG